MRSAVRFGKHGDVILRQPRYSVRLLRSILSGPRGRRRIWHKASETPQARVLSGFQLAAALLSGIALCLKSGRLSEPAELKCGKADICADPSGVDKVGIGSARDPQIEYWRTGGGEHLDLPAFPVIASPRSATAVPYGMNSIGVDSSP